MNIPIDTPLRLDLSSPGVLQRGSSLTMLSNVAMTCLFPLNPSHPFDQKKTPCKTHLIESRYTLKENGKYQSLKTNRDPSFRLLSSRYTPFYFYIPKRESCFLLTACISPIPVDSMHLQIDPEGQCPHRQHPGMLCREHGQCFPLERRMGTAHASVFSLVAKQSGIDMVVGSLYCLPPYFTEHERAVGKNIPCSIHGPALLV